MLTEYYSGDQIKKNATGAGRGTKGGQERNMLAFDGETWEKETTWKTQG